LSGRGGTHVMFGHDIFTDLV